MTSYIVHLYREMRLTYTGIEADTPHDAAAIAHGKLTSDADDIDDCNGEDFSALVDVVGDEDYSQSMTIDFEGERQRKATLELLAALEGVIDYAEHEAICMEELMEEEDAAVEETKARNAVETARAAIAAATGLIPAPSGLDVHALLAERRQIADIWGVLDVQEVRSDLTDDQAWGVLQAVARRYDGAVGINWDVLRHQAIAEFGAAPATMAKIAGAHEREARPYSVLLLYPDFANDSGIETYYAFVEAPGASEAVALAQQNASEDQEGIEIAPDDFAPLLVTPGHHHSKPLFDK